MRRTIVDIEINQPTPDSRGLMMNEDYNGSDGTRMSGSYLKSGVFKHSAVKPAKPNNAFKYDGVDAGLYKRDQ